MLLFYNIYPYLHKVQKSKKYKILNNNKKYLFVKRIMVYIKTSYSNIDYLMFVDNLF